MVNETNIDGAQTASPEKNPSSPQEAMGSAMEGLVAPVGSGSIRYLSLIGPINGRSRDHLMETCYQCHRDDIATVYLLLSTNGGRVDCGITMYNVLKDLPFTLITHNVGMVASIGNVVFLAGEMRFAVSTGCFLFHGVTTSYPADLKVDRNQIDGWSDIIEYSERQISAVLRERTSFHEDEIKESFRRQSTETAEFAFTNNIIHDIRPLNIAQGDGIISIRTS